MSEFNTVDEILDYAIGEEEKAAAFYTGLAKNSSDPGMTSTFEGFAAEEVGHKVKLQEVKAGNLKTFAAGEAVFDLKIGDYLVDVAPSPDIDYQDALIVAMKMEKAAFRMYTDLAAKAGDAAIADVFRALAQEEAKHKLRFEVEYDREILAEN